MKKTKILAVGDIHGDTGLVKKVAKTAKKENVDLIVLAGDLTWIEQSTKGLIGPLIKGDTPILIMPGNHETMVTINLLKEMYPNVKSIHGEHFKKKNFGIFGAGYATNAGPFWLEEKEVFNLLKKSHEKIKDSEKKIMVTHMHPRGSKNEFSGWEGSESVRKAIEKFKPDLAICSHIHEASGLEENIGKTKVVNVSKKPKVIEL